MPTSNPSDPRGESAPPRDAASGGDAQPREDAARAELGAPLPEVGQSPQVGGEAPTNVGESPPSAGARRRKEPRRVGYDQEGSWGAISDKHWTRTRRDANSEALEYYRQRSRAPGVREGGAERNFYCMQCDGVIPYSESVTRCPHCGAEVERGVKRYFNWVETEMPRGSDLPRALVPIAALLVLGALALWWVGCGPSSS